VQADPQRRASFVVHSAIASFYHKSFPALGSASQGVSFKRYTVNFIDKQRYDVFFSKSRSQFYNYEYGQNILTLTSYKKYKQDWKNRLQKSAQQQKERASSFNIFEILNLSHREVTLHTPFLAELLNIQEVHLQGNLFLELFLEKILGYDKKFSKDKRWIIKVEKENMDIRLLNYELNEAIYIENKIYSNAHSGQISRYYKHWLKSYFRGNGKFIYLTRKGGAPNAEGFNSEYPVEEITSKITCLSYSEDIMNFINLSLSRTSQTKILAILKQYKQVIERL